MSRYRHWQNLGQPGDVIFATTTVIDHVTVFDTPDARDRLVRLLFASHRRWKAVLHAYAVMSNHIHIVTRLPDRLDAPKFLQQVKSASGSYFAPRLEERHREALKWQTRLNRRSLWQVGFRSVVLVQDMFWQKVRYIHLNPCRASLVEQPEDYRWSSAKLFVAGLWSEETGLMHLPAKAILP